MPASGVLRLVFLAASSLVNSKLCVAIAQVLVRRCLALASLPALTPDAGAVRELEALKAVPIFSIQAVNVHPFRKHPFSLQYVVVCPDFFRRRTGLSLNTRMVVDQSSGHLQSSKMYPIAPETHRHVSKPVPSVRLDPLSKFSKVLNNGWHASFRMVLAGLQEGVDEPEVR